jgi:hypothetical protein
VRERQRSISADAAKAADEVQRLAVLLEAGVSTERAWKLLAEAGDATAGDVVAAGTAVGDVLAERGQAWLQIAVAWRVAETVGAPLAPSLRCFADALRDAQSTRDDVTVAMADPAATARLVAWLPLVALGLGFILGLDVGAAFLHPAGAACVLGGLTLMLAAGRWSARLVARAQPVDALAGLQCDVVAIALTSGASIDRAIAALAAAGGGPVEPDTQAVLDLSRRAGAPAVELLRANAAEARRRSRTEGRLRAARVSSQLLVPMGLCTLPAFLLLGVGPLLLSVLAGSTPVFAAGGCGVSMCPN